MDEIDLWRVADLRVYACRVYLLIAMECKMKYIFVSILYNTLNVR